MSNHGHPSRLVVVYDEGSAGVRELVEGLGKLGEVTFAVNPSAFTRPLIPLISQLADTVLIGPDEKETVRQLELLSPGAILTFSDHLLPITARLAAELGLPNHSSATADKLSNKWLQREALRAGGVDSVRSQRLVRPSQWPAAVAEVGLPAVVKPTRSTGSRNTFRVNDVATGATLVTRLLSTDNPLEDELVVEEFIRGRDCRPFGDYISVESTVCRGTVSHLAVTGKFQLVPPFFEIGQYWPSVLDPAELAEVLSLTEAALNVLQVTTGVTHTEIKLTSAGPRILEVNGRLGGWVNELYRRATGIDIVELTGRVALGQQQQPFIASERVTFVHGNSVPIFPCRLVSIDGIAEVRSLSAVRHYQSLVRPGTQMLGGMGRMNEWIDLLIGETENHSQMLEAIDKVLDQLTFSFELQTGPVMLSARSIRQSYG